ncbi:unnamed protein product, partial [Ectocarpus sp. 13 AM-2016]
PRCWAHSSWRGSPTTASRGKGYPPSGKIRSISTCSQPSRYGIAPSSSRLASDAEPATHSLAPTRARAVTTHRCLGETPARRADTPSCAVFSTLSPCHWSSFSRTP